MIVTGTREHDFLERIDLPQLHLILAAFSLVAELNTEILCSNCLDRLFSCFLERGALVPCTGCNEGVDYSEAAILDLEFDFVLSLE